MSHSAVIPLFSRRSRRQAFLGDDLALVLALRAGDGGARAELFDRYGHHVERVLVNVLGVDAEIPDLLQEVFARALASIRSLDDGARLKAWLTSIAVFTARGCIRSRQRRRWLGLAPPETVNQVPHAGVPQEVREALRCTYEVLTRMPTDERIVFSLRYVSGMELAELAQVCRVSLATIKRRIGKAQQRFLTLARHYPELGPWIEEGRRWADPE